MCSHYVGEKARAKLARMGVVQPSGSIHIYPTKLAPIIRWPPECDSGDEVVPDMEVVSAHFRLLPGFAKDIKYGLRTYNAGSMTVSSLASFKTARTKARPCIIPAEAIDEPEWRSGKAVPTRITRADGEPMGIAGLWSWWRSPAGEELHSFTMLTINAAEHGLMRNFHKPADENAWW